MSRFRSCPRVCLAAFVTFGCFAGVASSATAADETASCVALRVLEIPVEGRVVGTGCDDLIIATEATTSIDAGDGNDTIVGGPKVGLLDAGDGDDLIFAAGSETVDAGDGDDIAYGSGGVADDRSASDDLRASLDGELPAGGLQDLTGLVDDTIATAEENGTNGNDTMYMGSGNDKMKGLDGNDTLYGNTGDDSISGQNGNDFIAGGHGYDSVDGGADNDYIRGDGGGDEILGGVGTDTVSFATGVTPGFGGAVAGIPAFPATDRGVKIDLSAGIPYAENGDAASGGGDDEPKSVGDDNQVSGFENIVGSPYADYITGNEFANEIDGGGGADVIRGQGGPDTIYGGASGDNIIGEAGADTIYGGPGTDYCQAENVDPNCGEPGATSVTVAPRDTNKIAVGFTTDQSSGLYRRELYATGGSGDDVVIALYQDLAQDQIIFIDAGPSEFDKALSEQTPGCSYATADQVICAFSKDLDALVMSGVEGNDTLVLYNNLPFVDNDHRWISPILTGGSGIDHVHGTDATDDVLIDGTENDFTYGYGRNDALSNQAGVDTLDAGGGSDLLFSTALCDGDSLDGGADGGDDASFIRTGIPEGANGVQADLIAGGGGTFGKLSPTVPVCPVGAVGHMSNMENLEGSSGIDRLYGNPTNNKLMGHKSKDLLAGGTGNDGLTGSEGKDDIQAGDGADEIHARDDEFDTISCGTGADSGEADKTPVESTCGGKLKPG